MTKHIGYSVVEHDDMGNITKCTMFPFTRQGMFKAKAYGRKVILGILKTESQEFVEANLMVFGNLWEWKGYDEGVTLIRTKEGQ